jgi:hypothetical protein
VSRFCPQNFSSTFIEPSAKPTRARLLWTLRARLIILRCFGIFCRRDGRCELGKLNQLVRRSLRKERYPRFLGSRPFWYQRSSGPEEESSSNGWRRRLNCLRTSEFEGCAVSLIDLHSVISKNFRLIGIYFFRVDQILLSRSECCPYRYHRITSSYCGRIPQVPNTRL